MKTFLEQIGSPYLQIKKLLLIMQLIIFFITIGVFCSTAKDNPQVTKLNTDTLKITEATPKKKIESAYNLVPSSRLNNFELLNMWGEQTTEVQNLYKTAFKLFAAKPLDGTFADLASDAEFQQQCKDNGFTHLGGPMLGSITPVGAKVWLRTLQPAKVGVLVTVDGFERYYGPVQSTLEKDLTAVLSVTGLKPGTRNPYQVLVDGKPIAIQDHAVINTLPDNSKPATVRVVFGSCQHRWGLGNQRLADVIKSREPAAMLLLGDIAVNDRNNNAGLHRADYLLRDLHDAWKGITASIPVYATWDDHDYFDNDLYNVPKGYTKKDKEAVCSVFRSSWNNPPYGIEGDGGGVFFRTRIGPADVIMLDNRYFREEGNYLGDEQMQWLEEQLLDCKGPFIILANGTMWSDYVSNGKDSWGMFDPEGREKIFNLIEKNHIGGALLISGDRHGARGFRIPRPSGFNFYEFGAASLGGRTGPPPIRADWDTQLYGVSGEYAFGEFSFNSAMPDTEVTFRLIHERGTGFYEITLTKSQLTP